MRKVSIALRRLGSDELPNLTRAEKRALQRETDSWSEDLDLFLQDMQEVDEELPQSEFCSDSSSTAELTVESTSGRAESTEEHAIQPEQDDMQPRSQSFEVADDVPVPLDEDGQVTLYSRREAQEGLSVTFKLKRNGNGPNNGELTVYSHSSEAQLSGLGESADSAFAVGVPASSSIRLGSDTLSDGWEHLTLKGPGVPEEDSVEESPLPLLPVPDEIPGSLWAVPVELIAKTKNGLALINASDEPVVVELYLLNRKGHRLAGTLDPKLNPLEPGRQVLKPVDRFFPELVGLTEFYGTVVVRVEREGHIWAMGVIGDDPEKLTIRRALNMNVDLEGLKTKMTKELEAISAKEASLQEQMSHLDAVLSLASGNGDTFETAPGTGSAQSLNESDKEFSEPSGA
jgi:hypothetical protein